MRLILASFLVFAAVQAATAQYDYDPRLMLQKCSQEAGAQTGTKFNNCMAREARVGAGIRAVVGAWFNCMKSSYASQMGQHGNHARAAGAPAP